METKIAILRGINVGGKRIIKMADLKSLFENNGFINVTTYIQSGNIIFQSDLKSEELELFLEDQILKEFGFDVPVIIRNIEQLQKIITNNPYYTSPNDILNLHLTFLKSEPDPEVKRSIESEDSSPDKFSVIGKEAFIYCEGKYHQSKLTNDFFEKKLKVGATTRNWKTVLKVMELAH
nr:DUF1697 domain-containing protein [uncultured Carboxylicivirga sp.]